MAEIRNIEIGQEAAVPRAESMPRRLAAIVAGDIAGYSRLMQIDEEGTHLRVKRIERDLIEPSIVEHHGKLVKTTGDGFIAIFDSPVEAVRCGIVIQQNMVGRNASLPKHHWIEYRIGVNLGDVIIEADDIYGDGVNIATRLEGIADPGEVYISGGIYEQIKHKLVCGYESLGDRKVKNITDPVRVYRVLPDAAAFSRTRKRRENVLIFLLSLASADHRRRRALVSALQPRARLQHQAANPGFVASTAEVWLRRKPRRNLSRPFAGTCHAAGFANVQPRLRHRPAPQATPDSLRTSSLQRRQVLRASLARHSWRRQSASPK